VAFLFPVNLSVKYLENLSNQNFVGISLYIFSEDDVASIERVPSEVWQWLARRGWLISVNSKGQMWRLWEPILNQNLELSLLISHMGLPEISGAYPSPDEVNKELAHQYMLHKFPNVYLKLSGFYALEPTAPIFPYPKTYLYTKNLIEKCDSSRLIWGSDFTPALTTVSFAETFAHLEQWIVDDYLRRRLMYDNLRGLLNK
jgi:predicted TIM-barrel fold metal-dependent hydrolase